MASSMGPDRKVTDGLVLYLDATSPKSYPGSGTSWFDLISNESTGGFVNGPTVTSSFGGGNKIRFDATNDFIQIKNRSSFNPPEYVTCASWFLYTSYSAYWAPIIFKRTTGTSYYEQYALSIDNDGYVYMKIGNGTNSNIAVASSISYKNQLIYGVGVIDTPSRAFRVYVDGTCVGSASHAFATMATSSVDLLVGAANVANFQGWFGGDIYTAEVYNRVLTDAEILQNYNAVAEKYGKNVVVTDLDALAFVNKAMLTSETQKKAINDLVVDLKTAGIWNKMKAIYPMVGGTAASHKWNLKDPRDVDAAFRLTFSGGWTHSSTGAKPNGSTGYADTWLIPSGNLTAGSVNISYYSRTPTMLNQYESPIGTEGDAIFYQYKVIVITAYSASTQGIQGNIFQSYPNFDTNRWDGYWIANRENSQSVAKLFRGSTLVATAPTSGSGPQLPTQARIYIGAESNWSGGVGARAYYSQFECSFATIGDGLTDSQATALGEIVQKYQTTLGRQV